jgi:hypothetical protein
MSGMEAHTIGTKDTCGIIKRFLKGVAITENQMRFYFWQLVHYMENKAGFLGTALRARNNLLK